MHGMYEYEVDNERYLVYAPDIEAANFQMRCTFGRFSRVVVFIRQYEWVDGSCFKVP